MRGMEIRIGASAAVFLLALLSLSEARATRVGITPLEPLIKQADAVLIAEIREVKTSDYRQKGKVCTRDFIWILRPVRYLKGKLPAGVPLHFIYTTVVDDRDPCPRVYLINPPRAYLIKTGAVRGVRVIALVKKETRDGKTHYTVTATQEMDKLDFMKKVMTGK